MSVSPATRAKVQSLSRTLVAASLPLLLIACGGDEGPDAAADSETTNVRYAFQPDSIIQWMIDEGIITEMEEEWGVKLDLVPTFADFTQFAAGRSDVISLGTFETPPLEQEMDIETVTFGQSVNNLTIFAVRADNPAETLADLVGKKFATTGGGAIRATVNALPQIVHGLDPEKDFELIVTDEHAVNVDLVLRGEADVAALPISVALSALVAGDLKILYDGKWAFEIMSDHLGTQVGFGMNNLIARAEWFDANPKGARFLLAVQERALKEWRENRAQIIARYPDEWAVTDDADVQFMVAMLERSDYMSKTAYLDQGAIEAEILVLNEMNRLGLVGDDYSVPRFEAIDPAAN